MITSSLSAGLEKFWPIGVVGVIVAYEKIRVSTLELREMPDGRFRVVKHHERIKASDGEFYAVENGQWVRGLGRSEPKDNLFE